MAKNEVESCKKLFLLTCSDYGSRPLGDNMTNSADDLVIIASVVRHIQFVADTSTHLETVGFFAESNNNLYSKESINANDLRENLGNVFGREGVCLIEFFN